MPGLSPHLERRFPQSLLGNVSVQLAAFLLIYCAALMVFAAFARGWGPLHTDMTEAWAWGKEWQLGYEKHPPFSAWMVGAWFSFMPRTGWSFYLLACVNAAVGLAGAWKLAGMFLPNYGRWAALLLLVLTPNFSLWALKFNANSALLSTWPWTAYLVLRSIETPRIGYAILAAGAAATAMLTKYYSALLLAALLITALLHPKRSAYFRSSAPYVTAAVALLLLAPHIYWMLTEGWTTVEYAISKTKYTVADARQAAISAMLSALASLGIVAGVLAVAFGAQSWRLLKRSVASTFAAETAWLAWLAWGPLILTGAAYLLANVRITGSFLIPALFAVPVAFLVLSGADITRAALRRIVLCLAAIWLPLLVASPWLGLNTFLRAAADSVEPREEIAIAATQGWRGLFGRPLRVVAGTEALATGTTFYSPDAPSFLKIDKPRASPWVTQERAERQGVLIICRAADQSCIQGAERFLGEVRFRFTSSVAPTFFGRVLAPQSIAFFAKAPQGATPAPNTVAQ